MSIPAIDSPTPREFLLGLLALSLLTAPLWVGALDLGEPRYTYDRAEVTPTDTGIEYTDPNEVPLRPPISEAVECTGWGHDLRACAFEAHLLEEGPIPTGWYTSNPNSTSAPWVRGPDYQYVQIDGTVYEPSYSPNTSAQRADGMYRVDLTLEPADPEDVLDRVSLDADSVPSLVAETAREGSTTTAETADVPETPIRLDDDTYYRVYQERGVDEPSTAESGAAFLLTYIAPFVGLYIGILTIGRSHARNNPV